MSRLKWLGFARVLYPFVRKRQDDRPGIVSTVNALLRTVFGAMITET